jgi:hypothetical protein
MQSRCHSATNANLWGCRMLCIRSASVNGKLKRPRNDSHGPRSWFSFNRSANVETSPIVDMFFAASLLSYALLASTVFAVPTSRLDAGIARRVGRVVSPFRPADGAPEKLLNPRKNGGSGGNSGGGGGGNGGNTATVTATKTATATKTTTATTSLPSSTDSAVLTSSIWAGAGMESPANTYKSVTGQLVPKFSRCRSHC